MTQQRPIPGESLLAAPTPEVAADYLAHVQKVVRARDAQIDRRAVGVLLVCDGVAVTALLAGMILLWGRGGVAAMTPTVAMLAWTLVTGELRERAGYRPSLSWWATVPAFAGVASVLAGLIFSERPGFPSWLATLLCWGGAVAVASTFTIAAVRELAASRGFHHSRLGEVPLSVSGRIASVVFVALLALPGILSVLVPAELPVVDFVAPVLLMVVSVWMGVTLLGVQAAFGMGVRWRALHWCAFVVAELCLFTAPLLDLVAVPHRAAITAGCGMLAMALMTVAVLLDRRRG